MCGAITDETVDTNEVPQARVAILDLLTPTT